MIQWQCRQCSEQLEMPESAASESVECPKCGVFNRPPESAIPKVITAPDPTEYKTFQVKEDDPTPILDREVFPETTKAIKSVVTGTATSFQVLSMFGMLLIGSGSITTLAGITMGTTIGGYNNVGLLNDRLVTVIIGIGLVISGFVLYAVSVATNTIRNAIQSPFADGQDSR